MPRQTIDIQARYRDDITYLASQGYDISKMRSPTEAHRQAQFVRKDLAAGLPRPTKEQLRGHGQLPVVSLPKSGHQLKQNQISVSPRAPLIGRDLAHLIAKSPDPKEPDYLLVVRGIIDTGSPLDLDAESGQERTYTYNVQKSSVQKWTRDNPREPLTTLFHRLSADIRWIEIQMVAIAYPGEK